MSLMESNVGGLTAADVAAVLNGRGGGNGGGGYGWGDQSGWWILLLFLFAFNGRGFGGNGGGAGNGSTDINVYGMGGGVQRGFDQQATISAINGVQQAVNNGFADAAVARCNGNAAITAAVNNGTFSTLTAINGAQNAIQQGTNSLAMALQQCCCDNKAGIADLKYTVATENCQDRQVVSDGFRDMQMSNYQNTQAILGGINEQIKTQQQGTQVILDKLCQLELDGFKQKVSDLQAENAALRGAASQTAQTAQILANNEAQTAALIARLNPTPIPAYPVQNPNCCGNVNFGCGCGAA